MTQFVSRTFRRVAPWVSMGALLQAGSCSIEANQLAADLTTSIANVLVSQVVLDIFNLSSGF